jgi:tetratricopeptide (TPR) repeat protein
LVGFVLAAANGWDVRLRRVACLLVPVFLCLVPTARHNRIASGRLVPISVNGGINFYIGNNADYDATVAIRPGLRWEELTQRFDATHDPVRWQQNYYRATVDWMRREPAAAAALGCKKLVLFWNRREIDRNQDSHALFGDSHVLQWLGMRWSWFAPLGLVGLVLRRRRARDVPLHVLVVAQLAGVVAFFVTSRYRLVAVPWLGIAAGLALQAAWEAWRAGDRRRLVQWAAGFAAACLVVFPGWYGVAHLDFGRPDFDRAEVLARNGEPEAALHAYEQAAARHPQDPDVRFRYGEQLARRGQPERARDEYRRATGLAPWSYKPPLALGAAYLAEGDYDAAWEALSEAQRRGDPHGRSVYDMGLVRERQGRWADALELYRRSLESPDERARWVPGILASHAASCSWDKRKPPSRSSPPATPLVADRRGVPLERARAWLQAGDAARALRSLDAIEAGAQDDARVQFLRARALHALGRDTEARAAGERAVALAPQNAAYRRWLDGAAFRATDSGLDSVSIASP